MIEFIQPLNFTITLKNLGSKLNIQEFEKLLSFFNSTKPDQNQRYTIKGSQTNIEILKNTLEEKQVSFFIENTTFDKKVWDKCLQKLEIENPFYLTTNGKDEYKVQKINNQFITIDDMERQPSSIFAQDIAINLKTNGIGIWCDRKLDQAEIDNIVSLITN